MKLIKQISVFVENKSSRLSDILNVIRERTVSTSVHCRLRILLISVLWRMIVNDPDKAAEIPKEQ